MSCKVPSIIYRYEKQKRLTTALGDKNPQMEPRRLCRDVWRVRQEHSGQNALHVRRGRKILMSGTK